MSSAFFKLILELSLLNFLSLDLSLLSFRPSTLKKLDSIKFWTHRQTHRDLTLPLLPKIYYLSTSKNVKIIFLKRTLSIHLFKKIITVDYFLVGPLLVNKMYQIWVESFNRLTGHVPFL